MDANRIGLYIGVIALILAVPLAVAANLLTPRVQTWYGTTSQNRLKKRIREIEDKIASNPEWTFTPAEWAMYHAATQSFILLAFGIHVILSSIVIGLVTYYKVLTHVPGLPRTFWALFGTVALGVAGNYLMLSRGMERRQQTRALHTATGRAKLQAEVARLKLRIK